MQLIRRWYAYFIFCGLFLPYLLVVILDRRTLPWDEAYYAETAVWLFRTLIHAPLQWPSAMVHALVDRAPGICWIAQFFEPVGNAFPFVQTGLLCCTVAIQFASIVALYRILTHVFRKGIPALVACCIVASGSLFVGLTPRFFVEPLQALTVVWALALAVYADRMQRTILVAQLLAAVAFGLIVKTSTPLFQFPLVVYIILKLFCAKNSARTFKNSRQFLYLSVVCSLLLVFGTCCWYVINFGPAMSHVIEASSGRAALFYGSKGNLVAKLGFWLPQFEKAFFIRSLGWALLIVLVIALIRRVASRERISSADILGGLSAAWILAVLVSFSLNINQDTRYLTALFPYVAVVACWILSNIRVPVLVYGVGIVALAQWWSVVGVLFGHVPPSAGFNGWLQPYVIDDTALKDNIFCAAHTMDVSPEHPAIVGVELPEFDEVSLSLYSVLLGHDLQPGKWSYVGFDWTQNDPVAGWSHVYAVGAKYYLYRGYDSRLDSDPVNHLAKQEFLIAQSDPAFRLIAGKSNSRVSVYESMNTPETPNHRYRALLAEAAANPGLQQVAPLEGRPSGALDIPRSGSILSNNTPVHIEGWAVSPTRIQSVEINLDNNHIATAGYKPRPDIENTCGRHDCKGFTADIDIGSKVQGIHELSVVVRDQNSSSRVIAQIPVVVEELEFRSVNPNGKSIFGYLEIPESGSMVPPSGLVDLRGWAAAPSRIDKVDVEVDGTEAPNVSWMDRPDVRVAYPAFKSNGFLCNVDLKALPVGLHKISVTVAANGTKRQIALISIKKPTLQQ